MKSYTSFDEGYDSYDTIIVKKWMQTKPKRCNQILGKVHHAIVEFAGFVSLLHRLDAYSGMHLVFPLHRCLGCERWRDRQSVALVRKNWKEVLDFNSV